MDAEEFNEEIVRIKKEHDRSRDMLIDGYIKANAKYGIGDLIECHGDRIVVRNVSFSSYGVSTAPINYCYGGYKLTKTGAVRKDRSIVYFHNHQEITLIAKAENKGE